MRNRWKMRTTRSIRKATAPLRKKKGRIVSSDTTPSKEIMYRATASGRLRPGNRYSAVAMRRAYSTQNRPTVTHSTALNRGISGARLSKVSRNSARMLSTITPTRA